MRPSEKVPTENLLAGMTVVPVSEKIARQAGALRNQIRPRKILLPDCLIAGTAIVAECMLLTFNYKDYPFVQIKFYHP